MRPALYGTKRAKSLGQGQVLDNQLFFGGNLDVLRESIKE
jgi:hypothetical protein